MKKFGKVLGIAAMMFSAVLPAAPAAAATTSLDRPQIVQKISVVNAGAYVFSFQIQYLSSDLKWVTANWESDKYPVGQTRTSPTLGSIGVPDDALAVVPYGSAVAGRSGQADAPVRFDPDSSAVATYTAKGTTLLGFEIVLTQ